MKNSALLLKDINFSQSNSLNLLGRASDFMSSVVRKSEKTLADDSLSREEARRLVEVQRSQMQDFAAMKLSFN